jgi:lipopolysaccharide export LptBFGC system permease protein LptF
MSKNELLSITKAAKLYHVTSQSISIVIRSKRLNAHKNGHRWFFTQNDWNKYQKSKYDRKYSFREGNPLYDTEKISPKILADEMNVKTQRIYYLLRKNMIPYKKNGGAYVINRNEINEFKSLITQSEKKQLKNIKERKPRIRHKYKRVKSL